ncbi:MAG: TetR/AcrR family transcriptional regulator [Cyclobacteriaceae bacterium]|nr:TetR/AcrR family transcriptional regulator [Cyclobacteriaceae bacterium HetDA_MAG_MS6]
MIPDEDIATLSTEEKIKHAAARVFTRKGYAATKTRDIAEEAGINIASLHYYYRSKDRLFELIIGEALRVFSSTMDEIFGSQIPLHEKIKAFASRYIDFIKENPYIPLFIVSESHTNVDRINEMLSDQKTIDKLKLELEDLTEKGIIRPIHHGHFMMNLVSLTVFPFLSKPLLLKKIGISSSEYDMLIEERKSMIAEMLINYLYIQKPT